MVCFNIRGRSEKDNPKYQSGYMAKVHCEYCMSYTRKIMVSTECPVQEISHIMTMCVLRCEIVCYGTGTSRLGMAVKCKNLLMFVANKIL